MEINFHSAHFLTSVPEVRLAPPDTGAEAAFAGRSNAGKSSALNAITGQRSLARTSKSAPSKSTFSIWATTGAWSIYPATAMPRYRRP